MNGISVCIMTRNSAKTIAHCLEPLREFEEVLVLDTGSKDATLDIVATFPNARLLYQDGIENFGRTRNFLAAQAANDWILMVDSDEILTPELVAEIRALPNEAAVVYDILRINHYRGRPIRACGWFPDYCHRIYHRRTTAWKERAVHESLEIPAGTTVKKLRGEMNHFSFDGAAPLAGKTLWYAELFANDFAGKRQSSFLKALTRGAWMFFRCYLFRWGWLYGRDGFVISWFAAYGSFMKYLLLCEGNERLQRERRSTEQCQATVSPDHAEGAY